jgi:hypothetical protein
MKNLSRHVLVILAVSLFLLPFSSHAEELSQMTDNQKFKVVMTTPSDGFLVGENSLELQIFDADNSEVEGALISVKPYMTSMGHGVRLKPEIQEKNNGRYKVEKVGFSMPGHWQLIILIITKSEADKTTFDFPKISD